MYYPGIDMKSERNNEKLHDSRRQDRNSNHVSSDFISSCIICNMYDSCSASRFITVRLAAPFEEQRQDFQLQACKAFFFIGTLRIYANVIINKMADRMCSPAAPQPTACKGNHQLVSWNWVDVGCFCLPSTNR
jgi:hypothetical protein